MIGWTLGGPMALRRLAKDVTSLTSGGCPALYATDDPAWMVAQGPRLDAVHEADLMERLPHEVGVRVPTETVLRAVAKYATEQGGDHLAAAVETFLSVKGM
jgi:predicted TIM-barrel enzyme